MSDALRPPARFDPRSLGAWLCRLALLLILIVPGLAAEAQAEGESEAVIGSLYLIFDNDVFIDRDDGYTNGLVLGWLSAARDEWDEIPGFGWLAPVIRPLPLINRPGRRQALSLELAHLMFTPEDIDRSIPDPDDRPYAGVSYLSLGLHQFDQEHLDSWELLVGLVGDDSYAEEAQIRTHELIDSPIPQGWDHQIASSPLVNLHYEHRWRWLQLGSIEDGFGSDAIVGGFGAVGTYRTSLATDLTWRIGYRVASGFGAVGSSPGSEGRLIPSGTDGWWGWHVDLGIGLEAVAFDVTLDGRAFTNDDPGVDREPLVGHAFAGLGGHLGRVRLHLQFVGTTPTFEQEDGNPAYGRMMLGWNF